MRVLFRSMKQLLILVVLAVVTSSSASAETYFQDCKVALVDPSFRSLAEYFDNTDGVLPHSDMEFGAKPGRCSRIKDNEYVIIPASTPPKFGSLFLCNFQASQECHAYPYGAELPALKVETEFDGGDGKHIALLSSSFLEHGYSGSVFYVMKIDPLNTVNPINLKYLTDTNGVDGGLCGENGDEMHDKEPPRTSKVDGYRVVREAKRNVSLVFKIVTKNCFSGKKTFSNKRFLINKIFP
jgi:hypothetical protein